MNTFLSFFMPFYLVNICWYKEVVHLSNQQIISANHFVNMVGMLGEGECIGSNNIIYLSKVVQ